MSKEPTAPPTKLAQKVLQRAISFAHSEHKPRHSVAPWNERGLARISRVPWAFGTPIDQAMLCDRSNPPSSRLAQPIRNRLVIRSA